MMRRLIVLAGAALMLTACASGAAKQKDVPPAPPPPNPGDLPTQTLADGECGLFLWTQGDPRRFIFFSRAGTNTAVAMLEGIQETLALKAQGGDLFGQFMTTMDYQTPEGKTIHLEYSPGEGVEDGQKISSGLITIRNVGGWETLVPVVGLRACQPDSQ